MEAGPLAKASAKASVQDDLDTIKSTFEEKWRDRSARVKKQDHGAVEALSAAVKNKPLSVQVVVLVVHHMSVFIVNLELGYKFRIKRCDGS